MREGDASEERERVSDTTHTSEERGGVREKERERVMPVKRERKIERDRESG